MRTGTEHNETHFEYWMILEAHFQGFSRQRTYSDRILFTQRSDDDNRKTKLVESLLTGGCGVGGIGSFFGDPTCGVRAENRHRRCVEDGRRSFERRSKREVDQVLHAFDIGLRE